MDLFVEFSLVEYSSDRLFEKYKRMRDVIIDDEIWCMIW